MPDQRRFALALTAVFVFLAACGGDSGDDDGAGSTPLARRPTTQPTVTGETTADTSGTTGAAGDTPPPSPQNDTTLPGDGATTPPGGDTTTPPIEAGCPAGVICVDSLPAVYNGDTAGSAARRWTSYGCAASIEEGGGEEIYQVEVAQEGLLAAALADPGGNGVDVDIHILRSLDAADCVERGDLNAVAYVTPGTYYVVADGWSEAGAAHDGAYELTLAHTAIDAFATEGLRPDVATIAFKAFAQAWTAGDTARLVFTITDFSLLSDLKRMFVIDLKVAALPYDLYTTHAEGTADPSDPRVAQTFSNTPESHQSSLGVMRTNETYVGQWGYSLRLDGLEPGYNDNVRDRAIVVHPWEEARPEVIQRYGYLGLSWGCPAIDDRIATEVIDVIKDGALYLIYFPEPGWLASSLYTR